MHRQLCQIVTPVNRALLDIDMLNTPEWHDGIAEEHIAANDTQPIGPHCVTPVSVFSLGHDESHKNVEHEHRHDDAARQKHLRAFQNACTDQEGEQAERRRNSRRGHISRVERGKFRRGVFGHAR